MIRFLLLSAGLYACAPKPAPADRWSLDQCEQANDSLKSLVKLLTVPDFRDTSLSSVEHYFHSFDRRLLRLRSLSRPDSQLLVSLQQHPELIPDTAVLGGKMYFEWVKPIGTKWAVAQYSDGHIQGRALFSYRIERNGGLTWKLLDSRLD